VRILFWSPLFWPHIGGTEVLGAQLVGALHERGHEITVLTRRDPRELAPEDELGGVRIMRHPFGEALERRDIDAVVAARRAVAQIKREFRPDVIHVSGPLTASQRSCRSTRSYRSTSKRVMACSVALCRTLTGSSAAQRGCSRACASACRWRGASRL
jgi:nucleoside-diphosphate-sugar epimerase